MLLHDVARAAGLPEGFLAKIFQKLTRAGVVLSHRGAIRGYSLARPAGTISLREVLEAIEGPGLLERCPFWPSVCSERRPCCLHSEWTVIKPMLRRTIEQTTLEQIASASADEAGPVPVAPAPDAWLGARRREVHP